MCTFIAKQVFREAVKAVLDDEAFKLPSTEAKLALETAVQVMTWMDDVIRPENETIFENFTDHLFLNLLACFSTESSGKTSVKTQKESMWKAYHQLRISPDFKTSWLSFLNNITTTVPSPTNFTN